MPAVGTTASLSIERGLWAEGCRCVTGIDEAGRGAWAGPVAAAAVALPAGPEAELLTVLNGARDSKTMTAAERGRLAGVVKATALAWGIGSASAAEIDQIGILPATRIAMRRALGVLMDSGACPDVLLLDYIALPESPVECRQISRAKMDALSLSVACASILAKDWRDGVMAELDERHPGYGFRSNKGYGGDGRSPHRRALDTLGPSPQHRMTFRPVIQRRLL
ncbi:MAG: ribonuclease HII [Chloroflexi bacterium]|jgi:ribonuclease HII|nr:MAG: ribonuclease HII [Chloroflexi bacterium OLB13]MBC6957569.1 ribonuclease HII [Chloroflexota bacterium]MBV6434991.1 Ribonuclease HII [Anaerolineae bacterium]MDL1914744.1 ribonuclease HII [Anaerolineae bacterium CFX4]OQY79920.1 MAG: ribonuclease HII [Anaerolineae bacterium UTCFX5]